MKLQPRLAQTVEHMLYFIYRDGMPAASDPEENVPNWLEELADVTGETESACMARIIHEARCSPKSYGPSIDCPLCTDSDNEFQLKADAALCRLYSGRGGK